LHRSGRRSGLRVIGLGANRHGRRLDVVEDRPADETAHRAVVHRRHLSGSGAGTSQCECSLVCEAIERAPTRIRPGYSAILSLVQKGARLLTSEEVDDVYRRCLDAGARIHFPPAEDRDIPGYVELFFFDPDGFRIEIVHQDLEALAQAGEESTQAIAPQELARFAGRRPE